MIRAVLLCAALSPLLACTHHAWVKDFEHPERMYAPFKTDSLRVGLSRSELGAAMGRPGRVTEVEGDLEVIEWQRMKAVSGPDYVVERLLVRLRQGIIEGWKIERLTGP